MSRCVRGSLVFWLLMMAYIGALMCTTNASTILENGKNGKEEHSNRNYHGASLDSPADVGWRDWLLVEDTQPSPSDANSGLLVRRITPKSVFVAPSFSGCSEGYRQDGMGRCVKLVKVNQAAQLDFLLQKLNSMYAPSSTKNKNDNSDNSGPFHVSLPLGGLDSRSNSSSSSSSSISSSSSNNDNKKVPNDKQRITSVTMKNTTEKEKEASLLSSYSNINNSSSSNNNNNNNSSEIGIKKTEFLHNINLSTTTKVPEIIAIEPQQNNSKTTTNTEITTNFSNTNLDNLPTTVHYPVTSPDENQQSLFENIFDSTVKREPQNKNHSHNNENEDLSNTKKPFVIVVANTTYHPFDSTGANTFSTNSETIPFGGYDSLTKTTNKFMQTATEAVMQDTSSLSTVPFSTSERTETITTHDSFTTIFSTTIKTTIEEQSSLFSTTETTPFETISENLNSPYYQTHITTTMIPDTSIVKQENEEIDHEGIIDEEDEDMYNGGVENDKLDLLDEDTAPVFGDVIHNNKNIRESSSVPSTGIPVTSSVAINLSENIRKKCPEKNYGRINYGNFNIDCEPQVTTVRYPIRTTTPRPMQSPYFIRFPVDTRNQGYTKTNNYIRFPEHSSSSTSSFASPQYGTKLWNTDTDASSSSSMWYQPSWFPFLQSHRTWPQGNINHRNQQLQHQSMSTIYHKQYHQQHVPQNVPTWINS